MKGLLFILPAILMLLSGCKTSLPDSYLSNSDRIDQLLPFAEIIDEALLHRHLSVISHDSLEGRETGMRGQKIAADYLRQQYQRLGFSPAGENNSFYQPFVLESERTDSLVFRTWKVQNGDTLLVNHSVSSPEHHSDYLQIFGGSRELHGEITFAGFGVNDTLRGATHLKGAELDGRWVLVFEEIPYTLNGDTLVGDEWTPNHRFSQIVSRHNAKGIIVIGNETSEAFQSLQELSTHLIAKPRNSRLAYLNSAPIRQGYPRGYLKIHPKLAAELLDLPSKDSLNAYREKLTRSMNRFEARPLPYILDYRPYNSTIDLQTENVLALFEGDSAELAHEVVILTAHYDHIGITHPDETGDFINNGADDNGSGTVALLTIAEALQQAYEKTGERPSRSILFLHVSAEEMGLFGSRYYSDHPTIPLENTVASYNADMIGRSTTERAASGDTDYIYIIGGDIISSQLDSLVHVANQKSVGMELDYTYNDLDDPNQFYRRSDHWNFGRLGIPFVFFFTGVHEDYHRPGDTIDRIDFPKLTRTTRLIYTSTLEAANWHGRPKVDNEQFIEITRRRPR